MTQSEIIDYKNKIKFYTSFIGICLIFLIFVIAVLSYPVSAATTVNSSIYVINTTDTTIEWNVSYLSANRPLGATLDNVEIEGFQKEFNTTYAATDLEPLTAHTFCVYGSATINCETGTTTASREPINKIAEIVFLYIWGIFSIALIGCNIYFKRHEFGMVAFLFAFIGLGLAYDGLGFATLIHGLLMGAAVAVTLVKE